MSAKSTILSITNIIILLTFSGLVYSGYNYFESQKQLTKAEALTHVQGHYDYYISLEQFERDKNKKIKIAKLQLIRSKEGLFYTSVIVLFLLGIKYIVYKK